MQGEHDGTRHEKRRTDNKVIHDLYVAGLEPTLDDAIQSKNDERHLGEKAIRSALRGENRGGWVTLWRSTQAMAASISKKQTKESSRMLQKRKHMKNLWFLSSIERRVTAEKRRGHR